MSPHRFRLPAPAKINLFLHITGKRPDGYHLLQSLMVFVDIGDEIEFSRHDGLFLDVDGPFAGDMPQAAGNLVYKAAVLLAEEYKMQAHGAATLTKNLPVASGIAGGSSDAAAALKGFARLWGLPEEQERMMRLAQKLGADVPACYITRPVWAEGIGEKVTRLAEMPAMHFVLVNPMVATPTPEVFKRFHRAFSPAIQFSGRRKTMHEWIADLKIYRNDLTEAALEVCPDIRAVLAALEETPNCQLARLSGSGATCFGMYDSPAAAVAAVNKLKQTHPGWWVAAANLVK